MNASADIIRRLNEAGLRPPKTVTLAITNRCNLSCRHCWPDSGPDVVGSAVPREQVLRLIDQFAALGTQTLIITGGEPLTHPDWYSVISESCARPTIREVRLQTNAILITPVHVDLFLPLFDQGLMIQTSLEGATAMTHDRVRGNGSFDRTVNGLQLLVKAGMAARICITFTEMRHNFDEIPDLLRMADDMGIGQFVTGTLVSSGRAALPGYLEPPTPSQYETLLARFRQDQRFGERYRRIANIAALEWSTGSGEAVDTCCTFIETPYVTADGNLFPCVMLHANGAGIKDIYDRPFAVTIGAMIDRWSRLQQVKQDRFTRLKDCQDCHHYPICGAGCMGRAYAAYGDFYAVEDRCRLRRAIYSHRSPNP